MNNAIKFEHRVSSSRSTHVGESSSVLCDRLSRTREISQRQLPTDHDYAVSTREYQTDQSSLKPAPTAAGSVLDKPQKQDQNKQQTKDDKKKAEPAKKEAPADERDGRLDRRDARMKERNREIDGLLNKKK